MNKNKRPLGSINWVNRAFGFLAVACSVAQAWVYFYVPESLFSVMVPLLSLLGVGIYAVCMIFRKTASLAPIGLMCCDFLCICAFASAEGTIDYVSTAFFSGFSFSALLSLDTPVLVSVLLFIVSFILASVAMYIPPYLRLKQDKNYEELTKSIHLRG